MPTIPPASSERKSLFSRFFLTDLHIHSTADAGHEYGPDSGPKEPNAAFAAQLIDAQAAAGVEVIAVTDHNRVDWWPVLREAGRRRGVFVFPGVEINVNRCHLIGVWEANKDGHQMAQRFLTTLFKPGVAPYLNGSPRSVTKSLEEVLNDLRVHQALVFAPHATARDIGIFGPKVAANSRELAQGDLIAAFDVFGNKGADVLQNPRAEFGAEPPRWFLSGDVRGWDSVGRRAVWMKLGALPSLEGLRQAFLAPSTRVRFPEPLRGDWGRVYAIKFAESVAPNWPRLTGLRIEGGFHTGFNVAWAPGLNAIIGGKGTGKSALIEIVRHVLALPVPDDELLRGNRARNFRADADGWIEFTGSGGQAYEVRRSGGAQPPQLISGGRPIDVPVGRRLSVRVFGQRELSDLTTGPKLRDFIANRDAAGWQDAREQEKALLRELEANASALNTDEQQIAAFDELSSERLDLADRIERANAAGADAVIAQLGAVEAADQSVKAALAWPPRVEKIAAQLAAMATVPALPAQPAPPAELAAALTLLGSSVAEAASVLTKALEPISPRLEPWQAQWRAGVDSVRGDLERALAAAGVENPQELSAWHARAAELDAALAQLPAKRERVNRMVNDRKEGLAKLAAHRRRMSRLVSDAVRATQETLPQRVRIQVQPLGDRAAVRRALDAAVARQGVRGEQLAQLALSEPVLLADSIRRGPQAVMDLGVSSATATKLCALTPTDLRRLEVTETPDALELEMDVSEKTVGDWRSIGKVSPGQKATALLSLVLAVGSDPLIIDQPEDDLDNRYIYDEVVKTLAEVCEHRQVIVATHNANIPVLGDAELVIALDADSERSRVIACGGLESPVVAGEARRILEGGEEAFRARQRRYLAAPG